MPRTRPALLLTTACLMLGALAPASPAMADVLAGVTAWEAGDFDRAVREWRPLAVAGDADAQFNLGQAYKLGRGVPQDLAQAADWFGRAARQNHLQAQDNLGLVLYDMGNRADALPWLQQSAARGEPRAQFVMGAELFNGERISRDWPRAYAFMKRASDAGLQRAAGALVQMDGIIPLEQRQQGLQMAAAMEASEPQARLAAMSSAAPPRATGTPTIRTADLPPSQPGTSYTPPPIEPLPAPVRVAEAATAVAPDQRLGPPPAPAPIVAPPAVTQSMDPRSAATAAAAAPSDDGLRPGLSASLGSGTAPEAAPAPAPVPPVRTARAAPAVPPAARPAPASPGATESSGGSWRIQLGAFSNRRGAEQRWARVQPRLSGASPSYTSVGNVVRLQAGGYPSRAAATQACAAVRADSPDCFVVAR